MTTHEQFINEEIENAYTLLLEVLGYSANKKAIITYNKETKKVFFTYDTDNMCFTFDLLSEVNDEYQKYFNEILDNSIYELHILDDDTNYCNILVNKFAQ